MWRRPPKGERAPRGPRLFRGVRDPNRVLAAGVRPSVEPAVTGVDRETLAFQERKPLLWLEPRELHGRPAVDPAHRQRQRPRLLVPVGALEDRRLALEPTPVRVLDVVARRREDVEDETSVRMWSSARNGQMTSGTCSSTGGSRRSPSRRSIRAPARAACSAQTSSIALDESTPIT